MPFSYLTFFLIICSILGAAWVFMYLAVWEKSQVRDMLREVGVKLSRIKRTIQEFERKTFHLCGLLVPLIYNFCLRLGFTENFCAILCVCLCVTWAMIDFVRARVPWVRENFPLRSILREDEHLGITATVFFSSGCTLAVCLFPSRIAICTQMWLVLGDLSAAIFGISFGNIKIYGKKSLEGSTAMFVVCVLIGMNIFWHVHMREYAVVCGALVATLTELYEPFGLNDNLSIPVFSGLALKWGLNRLATCQRAADSIMAFAEGIPVESTV